MPRQLSLTGWAVLALDILARLISSYTRSVGIARGIDVRQPIVNEFLESSNLEANSRRAYERALKRFLSWSDLPFAEVTPHQISQYRDWLESTPTERTGKPLEP